MPLSIVGTGLNSTATSSCWPFLQLVCSAKGESTDASHSPSGVIYGHPINVSSVKHKAHDSEPNHSHCCTSLFALPLELQQRLHGG